MKKLNPHIGNVKKSNRFKIFKLLHLEILNPFKIFKLLHLEILKPIDFRPGGADANPSQAKSHRAPARFSAALPQLSGDGRPRAWRRAGRPAGLAARLAASLVNLAAGGGLGGPRGRRAWGPWLGRRRAWQVWLGLGVGSVGCWRWVWRLRLGNLAAGCESGGLAVGLAAALGKSGCWRRVAAGGGSGGCMLLAAGLAARVGDAPGGLG